MNHTSWKIDTAAKHTEYDRFIDAVKYSFKTAQYES